MHDLSRIMTQLISQMLQVKSCINSKWDLELMCIFTSFSLSELLCGFVYELPSHTIVHSLLQQVYKHILSGLSGIINIWLLNLRVIIIAEYVCLLNTFITRWWRGKKTKLSVKYNNRLNPSQLYNKIKQHFIAIHCFGPAGMNWDNSIDANL